MVLNRSSFMAIRQEAVLPQAALRFPCRQARPYLRLMVAMWELEQRLRLRNWTSAAAAFTFVIEETGAARTSGCSQEVRKHTCIPIRAASSESTSTALVAPA